MHSLWSAMCVCVCTKSYPKPQTVGEMRNRVEDIYNFP